MPAKLNQLLARVEAVETKQEYTDATLARVKRTVDKITKVGEYVVEGSTALEELYLKHVEGGDGGFAELKKQVKAALMKEMAEHMGLKWPLVEERQRVGMEWEGRDEYKKEWASALEVFGLGFYQGNLQNINVQRKREGQDFQRLPKVFTLCMAFSLDTLESHRAIVQTLSTALR